MQEKEVDLITRGCYNYGFTYAYNDVTEHTYCTKQFVYTRILELPAHLATTCNVFPDGYTDVLRKCRKH